MWTRKKFLALTEEEINNLKLTLDDLTYEEQKQLPWYSGFDKLWDSGADYVVLFGGRSNGKTFVVLKKLLTQYRDFNKRFVYSRRWKEDINSMACATLFKDDLIKEVFGEGYSIKYYRQTFQLVHEEEDEKGKLHEIKEDIGYAAAVSEAKHKKGTNYPNVGIFFLDEFIDMQGENILANEYNKFENLLSTVKRANNLRVIMCANTVSKYSEYFTKLGINADSLEKGDVKYILHPNGKSKVAVERTVTHPLISHLVSTLTSSSMISEGDWEIPAIDEIPSEENEWGEERLLFTAYEPNIQKYIGMFLRNSYWTSYEVSNFLTVPVEHEREFLVIREIDEATRSSFYNLTTKKTLANNCYQYLQPLLQLILEQTEIDVKDELLKGRVFCDNMHTADIFNQVWAYYNTVNIRRLL
jgi:hypothetical protein